MFNKILFSYSFISEAENENENSMDNDMEGVKNDKNIVIK